MAPWWGLSVSYTPHPMAWGYFRPLWAQAKAWATSRVTEAVRETLTDTPVFKAGRRAVPFLAAYIAASALLLAHALLAGTNISFASLVLLSAAVCVVILALLLLLCAPWVAADIPLMATVAYAPLLAVQCMLAAFATCVHQENRAGFAVASSVALFLIVYVLANAAFDLKFSEVAAGRRRNDDAQESDGSEGSMDTDTTAES